jgi:hypothetical protein
LEGSYPFKPSLLCKCCALNILLIFKLTKYIYKTKAIRYIYNYNKIFHCQIKENKRHNFIKYPCENLLSLCYPRSTLLFKIQSVFLIRANSTCYSSRLINAECLLQISRKKISWKKFFLLPKNEYLLCSNKNRKKRIIKNI